MGIKRNVIKVPDEFEGNRVRSQYLYLDILVFEFDFHG